MGASEVEGYGELIGSLRAQLAQEVADTDEAPIVVDGQSVSYLAYSHNPEDRRRGYMALVAALGSSPNRARYGLLPYVTSEDYSGVALDAIVGSYEPRPSTSQ